LEGEKKTKKNSGGLQKKRSQQRVERNVVTTQKVSKRQRGGFRKDTPHGEVEQSEGGETMNYASLGPRGIRGSGGAEV